MGEAGAGVLRSPEMALVLTTLPDADTAEEIVRTLLAERLIACGNVVPGLLSLYRWEEGVAREEEVLVLMKLGSGGVERLFTRVAELHPYTVPELVELPVGAVSSAYFRWVLESTEVSA